VTLEPDSILPMYLNEWQGEKEGDSEHTVLRQKPQLKTHWSNTGDRWYLHLLNLKTALSQVPIQHLFYAKTSCSVKEKKEKQMEKTLYQQGLRISACNENI